MPNREKLEQMSTDDLYHKARHLDIEGRSSMSKEELRNAVARELGVEGSGGGGGEGEVRQDKEDAQPRESESIKYSQKVTSPEEHEGRPGRSLVTRSHEVITRWAEERNATPATVPGTEHEGRPGVLRFNFPGYGGDDLKEIPWNEWLSVFDERGLNFIYQEHKSDGSQSNFFRLENPDREDA